MQHWSAVILFQLVAAVSAGSAEAATAKECPAPLLAEQPEVPLSLEQADIDSGRLHFSEIAAHGRQLFTAKLNACDGAGRPQTTGGGEKRNVPSVAEDGETLMPNLAAKLRTSGPDSDSCAGCHNDPEPGGAGDFVANVFVLAQSLDPVTLTVSPARSNSRNTLGMHGSGPIEMLAREMTDELQAQAAGLADGRHVLTTKGVEFEIMIADGEVVDATGIDLDLIVRPFHQAGKVVSLREFTVNAMNHHHGMQAEERFDLNPAKGYDTDHDGDGVQRELTIGDITAVTLWQAQLSTPAQLLPHKRPQRELIARGEQVFSEVGCDACHKSSMVLNSRLFVEPNPYNPAGTCAGTEAGCSQYTFDMTKEGEGRRLEKGPGGTAVVRAFTDLKRHNLCDEPGPGAIRWFCNEQLAQGRPQHDGKPGAEFFLTRKLWDIGSSAPYGHRGDISTITEAILFHGGEGRQSRDQFTSLGLKDQKALVAFLKSLGILPDSAADQAQAGDMGR